jgi:hypothetical protein
MLPRATSVARRAEGCGGGADVRPAPEDTPDVDRGRARITPVAPRTAHRRGIVVRRRGAHLERAEVRRTSAKSIRDGGQDGSRVDGRGAGFNLKSKSPALYRFCTPRLVRRAGARSRRRRSRPARYDGPARRLCGAGLLFVGVAMARRARCPPGEVRHDPSVPSRCCTHNTCRGHHGNAESTQNITVRLCPRGSATVTSRGEGCVSY